MDQFAVGTIDSRLCGDGDNCRGGVGRDPRPSQGKVWLA